METLRIDIWYGDHQRFGQHGSPTRYVNILGSVHAPQGIHAIGYTLNQTVFKPLPFGPTAFRLRGKGDFNVEIDRNDLGEGDNQLFVTAVDKAGEMITQLVTIEYTAEHEWEMPCQVDWNGAASINDMAQVIDGRWFRDGKGVRCSEISYDRLIAVGDISWRDYCVTVPITIHRYDDEPSCFVWPSHGHAVGILLRFSGHEDWGDIKPNRGYLPHGAIGWYRRNPQTGIYRLEIYSGADGTFLAEDTSGKTLDLGKTYIFKFAVQSHDESPSEYSLKVWSEDENEPDDWDLVATNHQGELSTGCMLCVAHHTEATYGDIKVDLIERKVENDSSCDL